MEKFPQTKLLITACNLLALAALKALPVSAQWSSINGPNGQTVVSLLAHGKELHAGTVKGLQMSDDGGSHWKALRVGAEARSLASGEGYLLAGLKAGLLRRSDGAGGWDTVAAGLPDSQEVAVATLGRWAFAGAGPVIQRSADQGRSWVRAWEAPSGERIYRFWKDGPDLFASIKPDRLLRSADSGITWLQVGPKTPGYAFNLARIGEAILICSGSGVSRLGEDGKWKSLGPSSTAYGMNLYGIGDTLFLDSYDGLFRSADTGATWELLTGFFTGTRDGRALVRMGGDLFMGAITGMYRSRDKGRTWAGVNEGLQGQIAWGFASSGDRLYAATEWGLFRTSDQGASWSRLDSLIGGSAAYRVGAGSGHVFVEGLSNGRWRSLDGGDTWIPFGAGLPETSGLRYIHDLHIFGHVVFATFHGWGLFRSEDWGGSWQRVQHESGFLNVWDLAANGNDLFLANEESVFRSGDQGLTWSRAWPDSSVFGPSRFATLGPYLLAGGVTGIHRTRDRGLTWTRVDMNLPRKSLSALMALGEQSLVAIFDDSVLVSRDTGVTWSSWQDGFGTKPGILGLAVHGDRLLAGTMDGVWARPLADLEGVGVRPDRGLRERGVDGVGRAILWYGRGGPRLHRPEAPGQGIFDARGRKVPPIPIRRNPRDAP